MPSATAKSRQGPGSTTSGTAILTNQQQQHHRHQIQYDTKSITATTTTARLLQPELVADGAGTISASMGLLVDKGDMGGRAIRSAVVFKDGVAKYVGVDAGQPEASSAETIMGMLKKEREDAEAAAAAAAEAAAKVRGRFVRRAHPHDSRLPPPLTFPLPLSVHALSNSTQSNPNQPDPAQYALPVTRALPCVTRALFDSRCSSRCLPSLRGRSW